MLRTHQIDKNLFVGIDSLAYLLKSVNEVIHLELVKVERVEVELYAGCGHDSDNWLELRAYLAHKGTGKIGKQKQVITSKAERDTGTFTCRLCIWERNKKNRS